VTAPLSEVETADALFSPKRKETPFCRTINGILFAEPAAGSVSPPPLDDAREIKAFFLICAAMGGGALKVVFGDGKTTVLQSANGGSLILQKKRAPLREARAAFLPLVTISRGSISPSEIDVFFLREGPRLSLSRSISKETRCLLTDGVRGRRRMMTIPSLGHLLIAGGKLVDLLLV